LNTDGTYSSAGTLVVNEKVDVPSSCLTIGGISLSCEQYGTHSGVACTSNGDICTCAFSLNSLPFPLSGTYAVAGSTLTLDQSTTYGYCVQGKQLHLLIPSSSGPMSYKEDRVLAKP
jgi:hypothetical protein